MTTDWELRKLVFECEAVRRRLGKARLAAHFGAGAGAELVQQLQDELATKNAAIKQHDRLGSHAFEMQPTSPVWSVQR